MQAQAYNTVYIMNNDSSVMMDLQQNQLYQVIIYGGKKKQKKVEYMNMSQLTESCTTHPDSKMFMINNIQNKYKCKYEQVYKT